MTMNAQKTFKEFYTEAKNNPTPGQVFVRDIAKLTCSNEITVRLWISGRQRPDALAQRVLAEHFRTTPDALFPKQERGEEMKATKAEE